MTTMLMEELPGLFDIGGDEPTLDELLTGVWEGLVRGRVEECPLCGDALHPVYGAHARPVGGRCRGCSTRFS